MSVSSAGAVLLSLVAEIGGALGHAADDAGVALAGGLGGATNSVRRTVLALLSDRSESTAEELAREAVDDQDVPFRSADRLALVLHHRCLPQLEEENYLEYDPEDRTVVCRADPESTRTGADRE